MPSPYGGTLYNLTQSYTHGVGGASGGARGHELGEGLDISFMQKRNIIVAGCDGEIINGFVLLYPGFSNSQALLNVVKTH